MSDGAQLGDGGKAVEDSVVRSNDAQRSPPVTASWTLGTGSGSAHEVRRAVMAWFANLTDDEELVSDLGLVTSELLANAISAARSEITVTSSFGSGRAVIEVADDGPGNPDLPTYGMEPPPPSADAGRGLFLVRSLCDEVEVVSDRTGTVVRCAVQRG